MESVHYSENQYARQTCHLNVKVGEGYIISGSPVNLNPDVDGVVFKYIYANNK